MPVTLTRPLSPGGRTAARVCQSGAVLCRWWQAPGQAGEDVLAILLVLVTARLPFGVGDRGDQGGGVCAEPLGQHREGRLPGAAGMMSPAWF